MDLLALLEMWLVHELSHTKTGGDTIGVPSLANLPAGTVGGWERVTSLKDEVYRDGEAAGYYALGGWLISAGYVVNETGELYPIGERSGRREL